MAPAPAAVFRVGNTGARAYDAAIMAHAICNYMFRARYKIGRALASDRFVFDLTKPELLDSRQFPGEEVFRLARDFELPERPAGG